VIASRTEIRGADIAQHYDELDAFYRAIWGEHVHHGLWLTGRETLAEARGQLQDFIADQATLTPGQRVCDIGCGYGSTARMLAEERGMEVTAITISPAQHDVAVRQNEGRENPRFLVGDWLANDLPAASFDAAIALESSEHMADKAAFLAQAHRVLQPGGGLIVASWLVRETPSPWQQRWLLEPICRESRMPQLGSESDYRRLALEAGFVIERFQDLTRGIARTWPMIVRTFARHLVRHPSLAFLVLDPRARHLIFGFTITRLWWAFRSGALRYGVFTLAKPAAL
jgi:tocopherol O-methyltransferase